MGVYFIYLLLSGTLQDFYRDAIWFNATIYNQYTDGNPNRMEAIIYQLISGLNVLSPQWRQYTSLFAKLDVYRYLLANENRYYSWIFSSLLFRLSVLMCVLGLLLRRKFPGGILLYFFAATLLARAETSWHAIPFIWLSLFAGAYFFVSFFSLPLLRRTRLQRHGQAFLRQFGRYAWKTGYTILLLMYIWSAIRGAYFLIDQREAFNARRYINRLERFGDEIRRIGCQKADVELLVYPFNPMVYFVTEIPPASKYTFMHPWVSQMALPELIAELENHSSAIVEIKTERRVWQDYTVRDYLSDLIFFLDQNYQPVTETLWMSKELAQKCPSGIP